MPYPPLRNIDIIPSEHEGEQVFVLHDSEGYVEGQVALSGPALFVAACLDGVHGLEEIRRDFKNHFQGIGIAAEQVEEIVGFLDEQGFLYSARFEVLRDQVDGAFLALEARPAALAGGGYPEDPQELRGFLDAMLEGAAAEGPGDGPLRGLVAPHIDFERGAGCYAAAYGRMQQCAPPEVVVIFGVSHVGVPVPFVLTRKDFETPLGVLQTDRGIVDCLAGACDWDPFAYEMVHRMEHSIEFQAVLLARLFGESVRIVPILCSRLCEEEEGDPGEAAGVQRFLSALREEIAGRRTTVIAGADWAHVGRRFGDSFEIAEEDIARVRARDEEDLAYVLAGDGPGFYRSVMRDGNARRVCGLACIYSMLQSLGDTPAPGELLGYDYGHDPAGGIVSFSAAAFH